MQRIGQNGGLCHGEQKANSYKIASKRVVVVVMSKCYHFNINHLSSVSGTIICSHIQSQSPQTLTL